MTEKTARFLVDIRELIRRCMGEKFQEGTFEYFQSSLNELIEEEREACAHLAHCVAVRERERWARYKEQSCTVFSAAEEIEEAIRARPEG